MACELTCVLCKASQHIRCKTAEKMSPVISTINFLSPTCGLSLPFASFNSSSYLNFLYHNTEGRPEKMLLLHLNYTGPSLDSSFTGRCLKMPRRLVRASVAEYQHYQGSHSPSQIRNKTR